VRRRLGPLAAVVAVVLTAGGCGKSSLDGNKLEGQIKRRIKAGGVELPKLSCPSGRKVKKGDRFQCKGEAANGVPITVAVVQTSGSGSVSWNVTRGLLDVPRIRDEIQRQAGDVTVDCQSPDLVAARDGDPITCQATTVGEPKQTTTYKVTANSNAANGEGFDIQTA
jgi:uncharacterized protein DUF4333